MKYYNKLFNISFLQLFNIYVIVKVPNQVIMRNLWLLCIITNDFGKCNKFMSYIAN